MCLNGFAACLQAVILCATAAEVLLDCLFLQCILYIGIAAVGVAVTAQTNTLQDVGSCKLSLSSSLLALLASAGCYQEGAARQAVQEPRAADHEDDGHCNVVQLKHCFYTTTEKDEVFLNLVLEFVPETVYRIGKHYSKNGQRMPTLLSSSTSTRYGQTDKFVWFCVA